MAPLPNHLRVAATRRFQTKLDTIVGRATPTVTRAWDELDDYDDTSIPIFAARTAPALNAVKAGALVTALGYYTILAGTRPPRVKLADVPVDADVRAPFISVWQALKSGRPWEEAVAVGRLRVETVVSNLAVSSARQTGDQYFNRVSVNPSGWERIPNVGACPWCEEVAGQTYSSADAADFGHDNCSCTVAPL